MRECQWEPSVELEIPKDWLSGVYLGQLTAEISESGHYQQGATGSINSNISELAQRGKYVREEFGVIAENAKENEIVIVGVEQTLTRICV